MIYNSSLQHIGCEKNMGRTKYLFNVLKRVIFIEPKNIWFIGVYSWT